MKLIALKKVAYAGRNFAPGDEFDAMESHARLLEALKLAAPKARKKREYQRRDMQAQT